MYNNIPPAGFPQIDLSQDVKRINAEISSMASDCSSILTDITAETVTVSGNPITISDALSADAISVAAEIEPEQDLHGYDRPWAGGAGKNKLPMVLADIKSANTDGTWSGNTYTHVNGVVVTVLTDNDDNVIGFRLNGTTDGAFGFRFSATNISLPEGSYIWNIQNTINLDGLWVSIYNPNATSFITKTATSANYTCNGTFGGGYVYSNSGNTFDNVVIQPMLRLASETDATFEPYSNICPISGMDSVTVTTTDGTDTNTATASLGTTVYGGSVDVTEGSASVTMAVVDMGDMNWSYSSINKRFDAYMPSDYKRPASSSERITGLMCSCYEPNVSPITGSHIDGTISGYEGSLTIYVNDSTYTDATQFKTARTGQKILYPLATPTTLSFTSDDLSMLDGENSVSTDAEEVSVEYIKNTLVGRVRRLEEEQ